MKPALLAVLCLVLVVTVLPQEKNAGSATPQAAALEAKIRKVWEDFKNKNKPGVAAVLANGFRELEEDGNGFGDSKAELSMVDEFELKTYTLKDFTVKLLGSDGALVNYLAHYEGTAGGQPVNSNTGYGEVWIRQGNSWKLLYVQETNVK